jgi:hypothetical protein
MDRVKEEEQGEDCKGVNYDCNGSLVLCENCSDTPRNQKEGDHEQGYSRNTKKNATNCVALRLFFAVFADLIANQARSGILDTKWDHKDQAHYVDNHDLCGQFSNTKDASKNRNHLEGPPFKACHGCTGHSYFQKRAPVLHGLFREKGSSPDFEVVIIYLRPIPQVKFLDQVATAVCGI